MVGGPPGTNFAPAAVLYSYVNGSYASPGSTRVSLCQGFWAYFTQPTTIPLASSSAGSSVQCPLQAGWNIVANPFAVGAQLPAGITAYQWDPAAGRYDLVTAIPAGGAVWINAAAASSIPLVSAAASPTSTPVPTATPTLTTQTVLITDLTQLGPYQLHVGDTLQLQLPSATPHTAQANPSFLHLLGAGVSGPLSCVGDPSCALSLINQFWTWQAVRPGMTYVTVTPVCTAALAGCDPTPRSIQVNILP
jgi:hypothetical protein